MARSSGCSLLIALVLGSAIAAPSVMADPAPAAPARPDEKAGPRPLPPEPVGGACTRARAETDLRARNSGRRPTHSQIDAEFERCFRDRIAACQLALDAEADEGFACWKQDPWPEVPASVAPEDIAKTGMCLLELKGVIADLRKCRTKKPAERDACALPYIGYAPQCPLLKADRVWRAFPGREDIERAAQADFERRNPKEAKAAKEAERCFGRTTIELADKVRTQPGPRSVPGCKYQVTGRVLSRNNVFVQVMDPSGPNLYLLRTKEPFAEGDALADRTAGFDTIEEVEMVDGSKRSFVVFKLDPVPPKKPQAAKPQPAQPQPAATPTQPAKQ